eukprot:gene9861-11524_t
MLIASTIFGRCPACMYNLWDLWCAMSCSPYQSSFVEVTSVRESGGLQLINTTNFVLEPGYASGIYNSCRDIDSNGAGPIGNAYTNYNDFFNNLFGAKNRAFAITFVFNSSGYANTVVPCAESFVYVTGVIIPFATGAVAPHHAKCTYKMPYDLDWDCGLAIFVFIYSPLAVISLIVASIYLYIQLGRARYNSITGSVTGYSAISSIFDGEPLPPKYHGIGLKNPSMIQKFFFLLGKIVAGHPLKVVALSILFTVICSFGIMRIDIEQDPVKLWVSPSSRAAQEKAYFDENFGPFYRIEQLIITPKGGINGNIMTYDNLAALLDLELYLMNLTTQYEGKTLALTDLCFQPTHKGCLVESITGMWQHNMATLNASKDSIDEYYIGCTGNLLSSDCMDAIGTPVNPNVVLGGWNNKSINATAFVTTFLLNNPVAGISKAWAWESVWLAAVKQYANDPATPFHVAYSSERSIQDELSREGSADIPTILISYIVMFLYVSVALGRFYPFPSRFGSIFVNSRFSLGLFGILVVAFSIIISVGICSLIGIKATLIISEVIPFLVLAIGVDNIFVLVNTFETLHVPTYNSQSRSTSHPTAEETLARAFAKVGPSMTLASLSESIAFLLGALTKMPAVVAFSYYASLAILFDFLLQITAFSALLVLDTKRVESRRIDCFPCVALEGDNSDDEEPSEKQPLFESQDLSTNSTYDLTYKKKDGLLKLLFRKYYAPFLVNPFVKVGVVIFFIGLFLAGIACSFQLEYGLDQRVALPKDSYLQDYFNEMDLYLEAGPPFYIVVKGQYDYINMDSQNKLCAIAGCSNTSIINIYNNAPYVLPGISSWLDDYISWSQNTMCCAVDPDGYICNDTSVNCEACFTNEASGRPIPSEFVEYLPDFLAYINTYNCPLAGLAYQSDTHIVNKTIVASRFDGYHTILKTQQDFINAMKSAYWIADHSDLEVFPYSVFYVFFEQYLTIKKIAIMLLCVAMVSMDLLGVMALWSVNLNAVSVVNVVMAIGISIEFCVHIAHTFIHAPEGMSKDDKAKYAISEVGSSIVSGIFITKLLGVVVLGFSKYFSNLPNLLLPDIGEALNLTLIPRGRVACVRVDSGSKSFQINMEYDATWKRVHVYTLIQYDPALAEDHKWMEDLLIANANGKLTNNCSISLPEKHPELTISTYLPLGPTYSTKFLKLRFHDIIHCHLRWDLVINPPVQNHNLTACSSSLVFNPCYGPLS